MNEVEFHPGSEITVWDGPGNAATLPWFGFARIEILDWWERHGGELVDVPASRFAERSDVSGELVWRDVPPGAVIRGVVDHEDGQRVLRIVTRPANAEEMLHFQHLRMPLTDQPIFSSDLPAVVGLPLFEPRPQNVRPDRCEAVQALLL